ncbi:MAG: malectin domain-containing carbohydrate-binding protein [Limisphaerales bacterium]
MNPSTPSPFQFLARARSSVLVVGILVMTTSLPAATTKARYYGHETVQDKHGVIAPWYLGLNGPCDLRVRIAAETLKRYPWTSSSNAVAAYPHYVFNGSWKIDPNGLITPVALRDWANGDIGQRATSVLNGFVDYYRYTGDPAAIAHLTYMADFLVDYCVTPPTNPWPGVFISVPVKGKPYGRCDPNGMIQLDLVACTGQALLRAYQVTGNRRWLTTAQHWGDLLAEHCNLDPKADPWPRYANPEAAPWKEDKQTGGVTMILGFLDELIRLAPAGNDSRMVAARSAGERYLRDKLLPAWAVNDTWGRYFWDWANPVQNCLTTPDAARYLLDHPACFPKWPTDARNILSVFLNHTSVNPNSGGDVYSGAWAYPESSSCCGRSLWYAPLDLAPAFAQYAAEADSAWARELALRQVVLQTYDIHENGQTEDNIDGGVIVNGSWFNIAHPMPLRFLLETMAWLPEELGANRENHIMRSSAVVTSVVYGQGRVEYSTFDAPAKTLDVLRLAFVPKEIRGDDRTLHARHDLKSNGYTVKRLPNGDALVNIRHDGVMHIVVTGNDPQRAVDDAALDFQGEWSKEADATAFGGRLHVAKSEGIAVTAQFDGNQVRLIGRVDPQGGLADVFLDGEKQLVPIDCWNPTPRSQQVLYYRNGLSAGSHTLKVVARGAGNPYASEARVYFDGIQFSTAIGAHHFPSGQGPTETQRMIFGYTGREDWRDSRGHSWHPATEFVTRLAGGKDSVMQCWWTNATDEPIHGTTDPQLYRYGVHATDFWVNVTVGPGKYHARLKWAASRGQDTRSNCFDIWINGRRVVERFDVSATAAGHDRAVDLVFNALEPRNGIIEVRLTGTERLEGAKTVRGEAFLQALEIGLGNGGHGPKPVSVPAQ